MPLVKLMVGHQTEILAKCREKMGEVIGSRWELDQLEAGLPILYGELIEVLEKSMQGEPQDVRREFVDGVISEDATREVARHAFHQGYTISQLVHGYGSLCQAITEFATEMDEPIPPSEFCQLNLALDVAIAEAVVEFEQLSLTQAAEDQTLRIGFLAHELRNALANASMANELMSEGGRLSPKEASVIISQSLQKMVGLIDRALVEARMADESLIVRERFRVISLVSEVEATAIPSACEQKIGLSSVVERGLELHADRHLITSAVANLVGNAIKFTPSGGKVWIRAVTRNDRVHIEVEDQGGGLAPGIEESVFEPYVQAHANRTGMGLGLAIARRAIELNDGELSVRNTPGTGCIFMISLPIPDATKASTTSQNSRGFTA